MMARSIMFYQMNVERNWIHGVKFFQIMWLVVVVVRKLKGPYANHILIPHGSTGSSIFFDIKWKPIFF